MMEKINHLIGEISKIFNRIFINALKKSVVYLMPQKHGTNITSF